MSIFTKRIPILLKHSGKSRKFHMTYGRTLIILAYPFHEDIMSALVKGSGRFYLGLNLQYLDVISSILRAVLRDTKHIREIEDDDIGDNEIKLLYVL